MAKYTICLDAGHYGKYNQSPVLRSYYESDMTWKLTNYEAEELESYEGIEVIKTRSNKDIDRDLFYRGYASKGCVLFESNHSNASGNEKTDYCVAICQADKPGVAYDDKSREIGRLLTETVASVMGCKGEVWTKAADWDRDGNGKMDDEYYGVLQGAKQAGTPGVIMEHGFHTNLEQATWLSVDSNLRRLAKAKAATIGKWLGCRKLFTDVKDSSLYYYKPVYWAADKGITNGYADGTFGPQKACTREAAVTFLWRYAGKPEPKSIKSPFSDVQDKTKYYYKAILWAAEQGITKGYGDGTFRPNATCLREHVVTFLWRYAGKPAVTGKKFPDVSDKAYYAKAVAWAAGKGITKGYADGTFKPEAECLREHVVTFLYRLAKA